MPLKNEAASPDNPTCKLCITRPCRRLFSGRVYPGKMIFVHRSEFQSLPCNTPNPVAEDEETTEAEALTDEIVVATGKVTVTNPHWEHTDPEKKENSATIVNFGNTVVLMATIKNYPNNGNITFDIYDVSSDPPMRVDTVQGKNENGIGKGTWEVTDKTGTGNEQELEFEVIVRSKASTRAPLKLAELPEFQMSF